jgi:hypothetical protein
MTIVAHDLTGAQTPKVFVHGLSAALEVAAAIALVAFVMVRPRAAASETRVHRSVPTSEG